jgi:hypothetical protein
MSSRTEMTNGQRVELLARAARVTCARMTSAQLAEIHVRALHGSIEQACRTPASFGWEPQAASLVLALSWPFLRTWQAILAEYEARYNGRRPHRGRYLRPPQPDHPVADLSRKRIQRRRVLGGPHQRVRAGRIEAQARASGRVLEPHRGLPGRSGHRPATLSGARQRASAQARRLATSTVHPADASAPLPP